MNNLKLRHVNLNKLNFKNLKFLEYLKSHPTLVLLIPTLIGGMAQILGLASLGLPFIKYFSYAQVIPDGLTYLIALLVFLVVLMYVFIFSKLVLGKISIKSTKRQIIIHNLTVVLSFSFVLFFYKNIPSDYSIALTFLNLFLALSGFLLFIYIIYLFLYYSAYLFIYFMKIDATSYYSIDDYLIDKLAINNKWKAEILVLLLLSIVFVVSYHLNKVNKAISNINNVGNVKIFVEKTRHNSEYKIYPKVLYFNREYIFVDMRTKKYCACDNLKNCSKEDMINKEIRFVSDIQVFDGKELLVSTKQQVEKDGS